LIPSSVSRYLALPALTAIFVLAFSVLQERSVDVEAHGGPALTPASVVISLPAGGEHEVIKTVHTPEIPAVVDVYFLADTTGSMGPTIDAVQAASGTLLAAIDAATTDGRYGAGDYNDFPGDPTPFNNAAPIPAADDNGAAAMAAIAAWTAGGGNDLPEAQLYALHQLSAHGAANFRAGATKFVIWFGDAPGHEPVCTAISGDAHAITLASLIADLTAAGIKVIGISVPSGPGLDGDPTGGSDYVAACGAPGGLPGQASAIALATGGAFFPDVEPEEVEDIVLAGLSGVDVEVSMTSDCATKYPGLIGTTFDPASITVASGEHAVFTETISVAPGTPSGVYSCDDWALLDGVPMTDATGAIVKERKVITVGRSPDLTVTKDLKRGQPAPSVGGRVYYLLRVKNEGTAATPPPPNTVTLIDTPPAGTSILGWSFIKGSGRCQLDGANRLVCDLGASMGPGAETIVEVVIRTPAAGTLTNRAEVDPHGRITESNETNNVATLPVVVPPKNGATGTPTPVATPKGP
jgi:uncharacterized repeat protein (TIGR01451 family)